MLKTLLCDTSNHFLVIENLDAISDLVQNKGHHLWLDLENPTPEEFKKIEEEFKLHPLAIEDATMRHQRPKVDQYGAFYFVVFYAVEAEQVDGQPRTTGRRGLRGTRFHGERRAIARNEREYQPNSLVGIGAPEDNSPFTTLSQSPPQNEALVNYREKIIAHELSMFMGENFLITVHEGKLHELDEVARRWYRNVTTIIGEKGPDNPPPGTRKLTKEESGALEPKVDEAHHTMINGKGGIGATPAPPTGTKVANEPDQVDEAYRKNGNGKAGEETGNDVGILLYSLLDTIVDGYFPVIDSIVDRIENLEEQIFENFNQSAIEEVFSLKKDLLALRKVLSPERDVLNVLTRRDLPIFEQHTLVYFQDVYDHVVRITDSIDTYRDLLSSALDSYLSMQSNRLNITVQTLTAVSILLMSIATVTGWFGMNFEVMPELHQWWGYPGVITFVATIVIVELFFFRRKGWI